MAANIRDAVRAILLGTGSVSAITQVIRPGTLAQNDAPPAILVKVISNVPTEYLNGVARNYKARVVVQAYAGDTTRADALAKLIRDDALSPLLKGTIQGIDIREVSLESGPFDDEDQPKDGSDEWMRHCRQEFGIYYNL